MPDIQIIPGVDTTGWSQDMLNLYLGLQNNLDTMIQSGQMINPDIEINEEITAGFLTQAQKELDPYYGQLIGVAKEDLMRQKEQYEFSAELAQ